MDFLYLASFSSKSGSEGANPECRDEAESGSCEKAGETEGLARFFSLKNPILGFLRSMTFGFCPFLLYKVGIRCSELDSRMK